MLDEFLDSIGFTEEQIAHIQKIYPSSLYSESSIIYNLKSIYYFFKRNGVTNQDFVSITMTIPNIIMESIENIKIKIQEFNDLGFNKLDFYHMLKAYPYILEIGSNKINNRMDKLQELSFQRNDIISMVVECPFLLKLDPIDLQNRIQFLLDYGYTLSEAHSIIIANPSIFKETTTKLQKNIEFFHKLGFLSSETIKITSILPELLSDTTMFQDKIQTLMRFGYSELDIVQMIKKVPLLLKGCYLERIDKQLTFLPTLGFTREDIVYLTCNNPYLFFYSEDWILQKIQLFGSLGFILEDVLNMVKQNPILLGYSNHAITSKIKFYQSIHLDEILLENSKILLYPLEAIQKRVQFLEKNNTYITNDNYSLLFMSDKDFYKQYHITKEKLLKGEF